MENNPPKLERLEMTEEIIPDAPETLGNTRINRGDPNETAGTGFRSFSALKRALGPAGEGRAWHHIVEQTPGNTAKFGNETIQNTNNVVNLPHGEGTIHNKISGYYSSKQPFTGQMTVRQWLSTQSYQAQYKFGIQKLIEFGWTP